ncbi:tetratricopeptide repeat protein [Clostridium tarantellae]|uniref:Tetratricopeptide repeat protein n=1 Tax=Clostridium tarantellae TaxID=39493 RepID=A0A6I1MLG3_9CLOT|nr:tetratricopeptide repeat protein [Clostridium tarantellae]MPQ44235.1 tetratricopeptide repeat protein [Clostridium tarantellae]
MDFNTVSKEKLSKLLFLEINSHKFLEMLGGDADKLSIKELYIPLNPKYISKDIEKGYKLETLPMYYLIEGMLLALGGDKNLRFNNDYKKILPLIKDTLPCGKKLVSEKVKNDNLVEALMILIGLCTIYKTEEIYSKLFLISETLREKNNSYNEVQLNLTEQCKEDLPKIALPYLYTALSYNDLGQYDKAYININEYMSRGGEKTEEVRVLYEEIKDSMDYEKGKEELLEEPEVALKRLLPLADKFPDNSIVRYYIATCYRRLDNYEKAIYYLNECMSIDNNMVETVNELGINYACLGDYENAIKYFRKAFEATRDIEVCTNLIMCYVHAENIEEAKKHLKIAKELNNNDEIVKQIDNYINNL